MKYMGVTYASMTTFHLHQLKSQKYNRVVRLRHDASTYFNLQEVKKLLQQIAWIDAELQCRADQQVMF
jgi:Ni,Fe-hydrogenase III large subunit